MLSKRSRILLSVLLGSVPIIVVIFYVFLSMERGDEVVIGTVIESEWPKMGRVESLVFNIQSEMPYSLIPVSLIIAGALTLSSLIICATLSFIERLFNSSSKKRSIEP